MDKNPPNPPWKGGKNQLSREERLILKRLSQKYHTLSLKDLERQAREMGLNPQRVQLVVRKAIQTEEGIKGAIALDGNVLVYLP